MGKASRKLKKKQQQEGAAVLQNEVKGLEEKLSDQIEREAYTDALDTLAELANHNSVSPQDMYYGAYAYFMLGDYDRSAKWIDNTLRYAPNHVAARILLARLCILQERANDGLAIFDLLTGSFLAGLSEKEREEIEMLAGFYGRNEPEKVKKDYPNLAAFLRVGEDEPEEENTESDTADSAMGLKLPSFPAKNEEAPQEKETSVTAANTEEPKTTGKSALEVLKTLKAKIDARVHGEANAAATPSSSVEEVPPPAAETAPKTERVEEYAQMPQNNGAENASEASRAKLKEILDGKYSISEKVRLLNSFAGGYYAQGNLANAELFLTEALKLDEEDDSLLRNHAVLLAKKGKKDKAYLAAARMHDADFLLLNVINDM